MPTLPIDSRTRAHYPILSGCFAYFPAALAGVAKHSYIGGAKYNDGALVHLRYVSTNHMDCIGRHLIDLQDLLAARDRGTKEVMVLLYDFDQQREVAESIAIEEAILIECNALSWRSLAISQEMHEKLGARPLAPAARLEAVFPEVITFKLTDYYPSNKIGVIKALRTLTGKDLKETVEFIADLPAVVSVTNGKYNLQSAKDLLTAAGGVVE